MKRVSLDSIQSLSEYKEQRRSLKKPLTIPVQSAFYLLYKGKNKLVAGVTKRSNLRILCKDEPILLLLVYVPVKHEINSYVWAVHLVLDDGSYYEFGIYPNKDMLDRDWNIYYETHCVLVEKTNIYL